MEQSPQVMVERIRQMSELVGLPAFAYSVDGIAFSYESPLSSAPVVGSFVELVGNDGERLIGQVQSLETELRSGISFTVDGDMIREIAPRLGTATATPKFRRVVGEGTIIAAVQPDGSLGRASGSSFAETTIMPASPEVVAALLDKPSKLSLLEMGRVQGDSDTSARVRINAKGMSRHTFVCGQSGSGKTFALGTLVEQMLLRTDLRIVVIDPNSDQVGIGEMLSREAVDRTRTQPLDDATWDALSARHRALVDAGQIVVARAPSAPGPRRACTERLALSIVEMGAATMGAILGIDPIADDEVWASMSATIGRITDGLPGVEALQEIAAGSEADRQLARRLQAIGIGTWEMWAAGERSTLERLDDPDTRMVVFDVGSLGSETERDAATLTVLRHLWERRGDRRPTLIVVDEAHNVCPREPETMLRRREGEVMAAIAGEGRKYGLHLVVATQRPARLDIAVTSQCDNLMLMRMNSQSDVEEVAATFSHLPAGMVRAATGFAMGTTLLGGPIVDQPIIAGVEGRMTPEGGGDVPLTWAQDPVLAASRDAVGAGAGGAAS